MNYNFKKHDWGGTIIYGVKSDKKILNNFGSWGWTSIKVQEIINGIESAKIKSYGEEYNWASEDLEIYANKNGVLLIDMLAQRAGEKDPKSSTLQLSHEEFLKFLQDFKQFVETNI